MSPRTGPAPAARTGRRTRLIGAAIALPCWMIVATALWLHPDSRGYDTHTQLGLSPCSLPQVTGLPCPTCGITTAFAHMAHGQVVAAFRVQAFGAALFVVVLAAACAAAMQLATGRNLFGRVRPRSWWFLLVGAAFFAAWGVKVAVGLPDA